MENIPFTNAAKRNISSYLERVDANGKRKLFNLTGSVITIGRNNQASIPVFSPNISRTHAILRCTDVGWTIENNKSLNGVYVNKESLSPEGKRLLQENDTIHLGPPNMADFHLRYIIMVLSSGDEENFLKPCKIQNKDACISADNVGTKTSSVCLGDDKVTCLPHNTEGETNNIHGAASTEANLSTKTYHDDVEKKDLGSLSEEKKLQQKLEVMQKLLEEKEKAEEELKVKLKEKEVELQKCHKEKEVEHINFKKENNMLAAQEQELRKCLETQVQELLCEKAQVELKMKSLSKQDKESENALQKEREWLQTELEKKENQTKQLENELKCAEKKEELTRLEVIKHFGELMETELTCVICSELFIEATALNCSHTFCAKCISQWKKKKKDCPICRAKIKSETRALVMDSFISKMVENLTPDLKSRRNAILMERKGKCPNESSSSSKPSSAFPVPAVRENESSVIIIGDSDLDTSDFCDDSESSVEGDPWAYYGGYGSCFNCGRRGHWANGCPDRY